MRIEVDYTESAQDNANDYYGKAKKLKLKAEGARKSVEELKARLKKAEEARAKAQEKPTVTITKSAKKEWYEKFRWFVTGAGGIAIGGRDAKQNELINSRYFEDNDLFFHANIFGASVVVLKGGRDSDPGTRREVAQFAGCHSSAWKEGLNTVDVYAMRREQVSKSTGSGSLGTGSFLLSGEREWYRDMKLALALAVIDGKLHSMPLETFEKRKASIKAHVLVAIGGDSKSEAAKKISRMLGYGDIDAIMQHLPSGSFKVYK